ncbi:MAG: YncE family protein [Bacteroidetes bacterium]|nr:YncE family protein [Bacteroidota bacterium]
MKLPLRLLLFTVVLLMIGCTSEDPSAPPTENPLVTSGVYILNEGGFNTNTATLSVFLPDSHKVYTDVFSAANNRNLGDIGNDIVLYNNKAYIVMNNSHRVEVISASTHASLGIISVPGNSPYKLTIVNGSKGYITNLYKGTVTAFDPATYAILKDNIKVGANPQGIITAGGKVFVCNSGFGADSTISVIDPAKDSVIATISVTASPVDIALDADGDLIVVSYGVGSYPDPAKESSGAITVIDPKTLAVTATIPLPMAVYGHPSELTLSQYGYGYTVVKNGILKFDTRTNTITAQQFLPLTPYAIAVDDATERLYTGDARDFNSNGMLRVHTKTGITVDSAVVGIIPGTIVFKR